MYGGDSPQTPSLADLGAHSLQNNPPNVLAHNRPPINRQRVFFALFWFHNPNRGRRCQAAPSFAGGSPLISLILLLWCHWVLEAARRHFVHCSASADTLFPIQRYGQYGGRLYLHGELCKTLLTRSWVALVLTEPHPLQAAVNARGVWTQKPDGQALCRGFGRVSFGEQTHGAAACAAFEVAVPCIWLACRCAAVFQRAKNRGLTDQLFLHVVPEMLMKRRGALVVNALDRESEDLISFPGSATDLP